MIRRLHSSARALKNPYYFYDLQRQQGPAANSQAEDPRLGSAHPGSRQMFDPLSSTPNQPMQERIRKVFGELGSREESRKEALQKGITVAGIHVPARPEEPTNCCMSGCVNCVWELYKDEIDEFRNVRAEARRRLSKPEYDHIPWPPLLGPEPPNRKKNPDKASHEAVHHVKAEAESGEDGDINTGIKVFIETEKRIRARKKAQAQAQTQTQTQTGAQGPSGKQESLH